MTLGDKVLGYRLEQELGAGGMGVVYKATNEALGQEVAVKVLDSTLAMNAAVRERFIQEARIQIGLRHPSIVQVLTAQVEQEPLALVMEFIDGMSLSQVLERRRRLPLDEALQIFSQVLAAVGHAHSHGVVHRDLKPSNIMVTADGHAKVMDFGIAKVVGSAKLTRTGTAMGSAHYMSPEQVLGRKSIDHRTDIYSAGITFFEMLTGQTPFEDQGRYSSDSDFLIQQAHVQLPPPDPRKFVPGLPDGIVASLKTALEKDPSERFQTVSDFVAGLQNSETAGGSFWSGRSRLPSLSHKELGRQNADEGTQDATEKLDARVSHNLFSPTGRIGRLQYGISLLAPWFLLFLLAFFLALFRDGTELPDAIAVPVGLSMYWVWFAQGAKRCHDLGLSGWYQLIPFFPLVMLFKPGEEAANCYGRVPEKRHKGQEVS